MKFTLSWLHDHLDTDATALEIAESLTDLGLEVDSINDPSEALKAFSICRVIEASQHPNADRLRVCRVETWPNGPEKQSAEVSVVCGAPNARTGMIGVFAPVGTHIPGTGLDLKKGVIRGVESKGMLCSERELEISDEHDGIINLPEDAPLGTVFADYAGLNDPVFDLEITPNRPDALGVRGIARDLAARGLGVMKPLQNVVIEHAFRCPLSVKIDNEAKPDGCPAFFGRVIRGVTNGPSPEWMQRRLKAIGLRPISALVDITNYVTYDLNRPLHAFDADKVKGGLRIHLAKGGETVTALDGVDYQMSKGQILISDDAGPESIAGVMGGLPTGCTEETVNVFLESALWDPITTAKTGRRLKIISDARYRFERGVDPAFTVRGLDIAVNLILDICGGEASDLVSDGQIPSADRVFKLPISRVEKLIGMEIEPETQRRILRDLGFKADQEADFFVVTPPSWRPDIGGPTDLVEEIARVASLTKLKGQPMPRAAVGVARPILTAAQRREQACRRTFAALGYNECVTYSFVDSELARWFSDGTPAVELENPISSELTVMRPDLLPGLVKAALANQARGFNDLALFEVGPVFHGAEAGNQSACASALLVGRRSPREPHHAMRSIDLFDAKADVETVLSTLLPGVKPRYMRNAPSWWHPQRSGLAFLQPGKPLAVFGELNPKLLRKFGLKGPVSAMTLFLDALPMPKRKGKARAAFQPSTLQHVDRDFAFVVGQRVEAATVTGAVLGSKYRKLVSSVQVFDEYSGTAAEAQLGEGNKSLAVSVRLQPEKSAFKEVELEAICSEIAQKVESTTGGSLRR